MKFVIPSLRVRLGGPLVLHELCKELNAQGHEAKMFYSNIMFYDSKTNMFVYWTKWILSSVKSFLIGIYDKIMHIEEDNHFCWDMKGEDGKHLPRKYLPFISDDTIVVYPDNYFGNFLHAKNYVYWFLGGNRFKGETGGPTSDDLVFSYRKVFNDEEINPECRLLYIENYNLDLYKRYNFGEREGKCYVVRKGKFRDDLPDFNDGIVVDDLTEREKVKHFNECEYCICYDTQTAYAEIASLCGCITIVVPEKDCNIGDYKKEDDICAGIAYGFSEEEIKRAKETQPELVKYFENIGKSNSENIKKFINACEKKFCV